MTRARAIELLKENLFCCNFEECNNAWDCDECVEALNMAIEELEKESIIHCKDCKHWHEWENGTGSCHRSGMMWVGSDYDDYCSYAERMESDAE